MDIRTIEELDKVLEDRKKEGFNHPHDEELFLHIMALAVHHPEEMYDRFSKYHTTLSASGKIKAAEALITWINCNLGINLPKEN